ncbi:MAG: hypothetical protein J6N19_06750 [Clostridium sp.]|nr:hypothetical protein [Clostridium sp.]
MSNKEEKNMEANDEMKNGTEDIKGTDFVEPQGKFRKVIKWLIGGAALVVSGLVGGLIGHHIGSGSDDDDNGADSSNETTTEA